MIPRLGVGGLHHGQLPTLVEQVLRHENSQDGIHPVVAETLGRLVADDVRDARRHRADLGRRRDVLVFGHGPLLSDYGFGLSGKKFAGVFRGSGDCEVWEAFVVEVG